MSLTSSKKMKILISQLEHILQKKTFFNKFCFKLTKKLQMWFKKILKLHYILFFIYILFYFHHNLNFLVVTSNLIDIWIRARLYISNFKLVWFLKKKKKTDHYLALYVNLCAPQHVPTFLDQFYITRNSVLALFCPNINTISNGSYNCTRNFQMGSICTFTCNNPTTHELDPPDHPGLLCYKTSAWIGPPSPTCKRKLSWRVSKYIIWTVNQEIINIF